MKTTDLVAWVGATTGLASLIWNIYAKLTANRPRLTVTVLANMILMPAPPHNPRLLKIAVQNVGTATTTLTNFEFFTFIPRWERFLSRLKLRKRPTEKRAVLNNHRGPKFPHKLEVGSEWQGVMTQDKHFEDWLHTGNLRCGVHHSFSKRLVTGKIIQPL